MANDYYENPMMPEWGMMQENIIPCPMGYDNLSNTGYPMMGNYKNAALVKTIQDCEATCEHMTDHLKRLPDFRMRTRQAVLLRDCADICGLTARYLARGSEYSRWMAGLCANICEACGNECARFSDQMSQNCARVCLNCARECRAFAGMM